MMPPRSKILSMPRELQEELNARLVAGGFKDYEALAQWLNIELQARGLALTVSHMAVPRHGEKFAERLERLRLATDQAKALADGAGDDEGAMSDALVRLVQERLFTLLMEMGDIDPKKVNISGLLKGIAQITKASISQKQWMVEIQGKIKAAAERATGVATRGGLSADAVDAIKREILGISQ